MNRYKFRSEETRLESFKYYKPTHCNFTDEIKENFARTGFYWSGEGEEVKCNFCQFTIPQLQKGEEDPVKLHCRYNSTCPIICRSPTNNIPIDADLLEKSLPTKPIFVAGTKPPKHPDYSTKESREYSFRRWPSNHCIRVKDLVSAGFFYLGYGDLVCCYSCGLGLKEFDRGEIPLETHKKHRSDCLFIQYLNECEANNKLPIYTRLSHSLSEIWNNRRSCNT